MNPEHEGHERPAPETDDLAQTAEMRRYRVDFWHREGEQSVAQNLGRIGVLGWLIVMPMVGGLMLGRWLDDKTGAGLLWSGALLILGTAIGCRLGWTWMQRQ